MDKGDDELNGVGGLEGAFERRGVGHTRCVFSTLQIQIVDRYKRNEI